VRSLTALTLGAALALGIGATIDQPSPPRCFEDEVIVWSGADDTHSVCVPLDNLDTGGNHG
jgi:hypothetical protein